MNIIEFTGARLKNLVTHHVGNKSREENLVLSERESETNEETTELLIEYFLFQLNTDEIYSFSHSVDLEMNEVYQISRRIFNGQDMFIDYSKDLARLLYEQSEHPQIKEGKLNVAYFENIRIDNEVVDAIGIFKSEKDVPFLRMKKGNSRFSIEHENGFEIKGIEKACLILNHSSEEGFKLLILDKTSKQTEARYWKDDFLEVRQLNNEFYQTKEFLNITREYITSGLKNEFEVTKADQIDLLNKSVSYFKNRDSFHKEEFQEEVFQDNNVIESFRNFNNGYLQENQIEVAESFDISKSAVKKQARGFKSVLKLDKNFHIYIHGDRELIQQGVDPDGRKYYKIFYEEEK